MVLTDGLPGAPPPGPAELRLLLLLGSPEGSGAGAAPAFSAGRPARREPRAAAAAAAGRGRGARRAAEAAAAAPRGPPPACPGQAAPAALSRDRGEGGAARPRGGGASRTAGAPEEKGARPKKKREPRLQGQAGAPSREKSPGEPEEAAASPPQGPPPACPGEGAPAAPLRRETGGPEGKGGAPRKPRGGGGSRTAAPPEPEQGGPPGPAEGKGARPKKKREPRLQGKAGAPSREKSPGEPEEAAAAASPPGRPVARRKSGLRRVVESLALRSREVSGAALLVNAVRDLLKDTVATELGLPAVDHLGTGSYYEHLKIIKPDEFDIMLKVPEVRVDLECYDAGDCKGVYKFVKLKRYPQLNKFVDDQQRLSASRFLKKLREIIINKVKTINEMKVTVEEKKPGSPAVTLLIGEPPSHISVDLILGLEMASKTVGNYRKGGPDIKKWLGIKQEKELDNMKLFLVPKNAKDGTRYTDTWRLSFSLAEKNLIQYHGNKKTCCGTNESKCCRKDCLKLLKYLLEQLRTKHRNRNQFNKFCSYHAKTAFFHVCTMWTSDEEWLPTNLDECFERLLDYFLDCLKKAELKHFFIPECNLFCTDSKCSILAKVIESERTNGYPIFKQT